MKRVALLLSLVISAQANAGLMNFQATTTFPGLATNFSITYNDTGDGLLQLAEIVSFTGVTFALGDAGLDGFYNAIVGVPNISGFASGVGGFPPGAAWEMGRPKAGGEQQVISPPIIAWTYATSPAQVPEPGTLSLIGAGLMGLSLLRRRSA